MANCESSQVCAEVVQLLLEAGRRPDLARNNGITPLRGAALHGDVDVADMLYTRSPRHAELLRCRRHDAALHCVQRRARERGI